MNTQNLQMRTLASLISENKSVAFISGNRKTDKKNISSKKKSFEDFKCNIVPLMYVSGTKAVADGCKLVDADTNEIVSEVDAYKYIVIVDGQHRYNAAIYKKIPNENIILFEDYTGADTKKLLATANIDSQPWKSSDYVSGAVLFDSENEIAIFAKELSDKNYPISTIGKIMCFASGRLGKTQFAQIMAGKNVEIKGLDIERANRFLSAAEAANFSNDFIASRYLIDAVIELKGEGEELVIQAIAKLPSAIVAKIQNANSDEKSGLIENALKKLINA